MRIALCSTSDLKAKAIRDCLDSWKIEYHLTLYEVKDPDQLAQPFNESGTAMARNRIDWVRANHPEVNQTDLICSIENYLQRRPYNTNNVYEDQACIIMYNPQRNYEYRTQTEPIPVPETDLVEELLEKYPETDQQPPRGTTKTFGELYHHRHPHIPANNWMKFCATGQDRGQMLQSGISRLVHQYRADLRLFERLNTKFKYHQDFPIKGVGFMDWSDLFLDNNLLANMMLYLGRKYAEARIDYVIGLESRGFLIAVPLAQRLQTGFVPLRKAGKLPDPKITQSYQKEYGEDTFELRYDLKPGRVVIVDDILATGGSLKAAIQLAQAAGHTVVDSLVIRDIPPLRQKAKEMLTGTKTQYSVLIQP